MEKAKGPESSGQRTETATLAGGCFWCLEAVFRDMEGVKKVVSGYSGGDPKNPDYAAVCTGITGHAEAVQLTFDPDIVSFEEILRVFFSIHDPTTLNAQGPDIGTQYRSVIFYHSKGQKETAERVIRDLETAGTWENPIVTEVIPLKDFYPAEDYHQEYFNRNPEQAYCRFIVAPKVAKFHRLYPEKAQRR